MSIHPGKSHTTLLTMVSDVVMDLPISEASSGVKRPSVSPNISSNTSKRARLEIPPEQLTTVNEEMILASTDNGWDTGFKNAADDPQAMKRLSSYILLELNHQLSSTNAKASTLPVLTRIQAKAVVDGFNEDELRAWKAGLQNAIKNGDWGDLITHQCFLRTRPGVTA